MSVRAASGFTLATILVVGGLAACRGTPNLPPGERTCLGFPADVCRRQVEELQLEGAAHGGVVAYRILCTSGACTAERGDGTIAVVFADGRGREGGFGYAVPMGTPPERTMGPLPVVPSCIRVAPEVCDEWARTIAEEVPDWSTIRVITIRCTSASPCTEAAGDGEMVVELADGTVRTGAWSTTSGE
jgi:hypothetical protein